MSIRWVVFDAVGTLMHAEPGVADAYFRIGSRFGSQYSREAVRSRFRDAFRASESDDQSETALLVTSEAREERRWRGIVGQVFDDIVDQQGCFEELYAHFAQPQAWHCYADVSPALQAVTQRGLGCAIASNFDQRLHAVCDVLHPLTTIQRRFVSSEVGWRKPAQQFFMHVAAQLQCGPEEILFVGDDPDADAGGAVRAGMRALHLDRTNSEPQLTVHHTRRAIEDVDGAGRIEPTSGVTIPIISSLLEVEKWLS